MKTRICALLVVALLALPVFAQAQQLFDGAGQAMVPDALGGYLTMYSVLYDGSPAIEAPIPLDFANYEYTMVVTNLMFSSATMFGGTYTNGDIVIYEDNGTVADFGDPTTFTDGTAILVGTIGELVRNLYPMGTGTAQSDDVDWVGGTRLNEMASEDQVDWALLSGLNVNAGVIDGYDEVWDCKVEPSEPIVDTERILWGSLKSEY